LDGDHIVGASDLAAVLGAWGAAHGSAPEDLDDSGIVDAADIALVLGGWGACVESCDQTTISGRVAFADGSAAPGAVIVSELGGSGVSNGDEPIDGVADADRRRDGRWHHLHRHQVG
jgi:hypothetical protein